MEINTPTLIIDEAKTRSNIQGMAEKAKRNHLKFRPHFKTHQSRQIGEWFKDAGVQSITVSSLGMAEYFAQVGWQEITVAFPCNILQIDLINDLASKTRLILLVDNKEVVHKLRDQLVHEVEVFIEVDTGTNRTGVLWNNQELIKSIADAILDGKHTRLKGFYSHSGISYSSKGVSEILQVYEDSISRIAQLKSWVSTHYGDLEFCYGDTPTCSFVHDFKHVDAISPGNFAFYDIMQEQIGSCGFQQVAVAMACPVVSIKHERQEVCIYGGAIHFSKDFIMEDDHKVFGKLVVFDGNKWSEPLKDCYIKSLSQEHGLVHLNNEVLKEMKIGDILYFLPVHSCLTAECMRQYVTLTGETLDHY